MSTVSAFVDEGYAATQLLAIRRLTEKPGRRRDQISLPRLIDDMKENASLFKRELYVAHDGLPFDPVPSEPRLIERIIAERVPGSGVAVRSEEIGGSDDGHSSRRRHMAFDRLIGSEDVAWGRDDTIPPDLFDRLNLPLGVCAAINRVADKFIAHAADARSRGEIPERERSITLAKIEICHRAICQVAAFIHGPLLYIGSHGILPIPQYDHLSDLDKRWILPTELESLHRIWDTRDQKLEKWIEEPELMRRLL